MSTTAEARKEEIIAATLRLISEQGIAQFTTANLARELGFSEALIFRYFPSKDEIIFASITALQEQLLTGVRNSIARGSNSLEKLKRLLLFNLSMLASNAGIPRLVFAEQLYLRNSELKSRFRTLYLTIHSTLTEVFSQGIQEGVFRADLNPALAATTWIGFLHGWALEWVHAARKSPVTDDEAEEIYLFLIGLFAKETCTDKEE